MKVKNYIFLDLLKFSITVLFLIGGSISVIFNSEQFSLLDLLLFINLLLFAVGEILWYYKSWDKGDKFLILTPIIINLSLITMDLVASVQDEIGVLESIYNELLLLNFTTMILLFAMNFIRPFWLQKTLNYMEPYFLVHYFLYLLQLSYVGLLVIYPVQYYLFPVILLISYYFERKEILMTEDKIFTLLKEQNQVDVSGLSYLRYKNEWVFPYFKSHLEAKLGKPVYFEVSSESITSTPSYDLILSERNMFLEKGALLRINYGKNEEKAVKNRNFFNKGLRIALIGLIFVIPLVPITLSDTLSLVDTLFFALLVIVVIFAYYFFYHHPVFKELINLIFAQDKLMIYENGIWVQLEDFDNDMRFIRYIDMEYFRIESSDKSIIMGVANKKIRIDLDRYSILDEEIDSLRSLLENKKGYLRNGN